VIHATLTPGRSQRDTGGADNDGRARARRAA
jgi:hypothetical protein